MSERELTRDERRDINKLVTGMCANYDGTYKICLPLDCECYMLNKWWTGALCKYFQNAVLPLDPALESALTGQRTPDRFKPCETCGTLFPGDGRRRYCCPRCADKGRKRRIAQRVKKHRENRR